MLLFPFVASRLNSDTRAGVGYQTTCNLENLRTGNATQLPTVTKTVLTEAAVQYMQPVRLMGAAYPVLRKCGTPYTEHCVNSLQSYISNPNVTPNMLLLGVKS